MRRSDLSFVVQLLIVSVCTLAGCTALLPAEAGSLEQGSAALRQKMDAAHRAERVGNLDEAAAHYREFLGLALDELAMDHAELGDYLKTKSYLDEGLEVAPDALGLHRDYAMAALEAGDLQQAETMARFALAHPPSEGREVAAAHQLLGRVLLRMNRYQDARREMEAAVALDPNFADQYGLAVVCLDMDDENCTAGSFARMEKSFGDTPALHMQIGRAYGNSDFSPRAVAEFRKVIAEDPRMPGAHYSLAAALLSAGEDAASIREAEAELKKELALSSHDYLTFAALGKLAATNHRNGEAEQLLKQAIALDGKNPDAYLYLGQLDFDSNRMDEAESALRQAIHNTTDVARNRYQVQKAHFLLGRILMQQHHAEEAHAEMQIAHALADKTLSKDKNQLAGMLTGNLGQTMPTATAMDAATVGVPTHREVDPVLVRQQEALEKRMAAAIADCYNNLGVIAAGREDYNSAYAEFAHAAHWNPALDGVDYNLGRAAFMTSRFAAAVPQLTRSLQAHPNDTGVLNALAMSLFMTKEYRRCLDVLARADVSAIPQMTYIYAESQMMTGATAEGEARLQQLETAHPEIAEVHRALADAYRRAARFADADREQQAYEQLTRGQ